MPDAVSIKIEGLRELDQQLRSFGPRMAANALRAACNAGAQVIRKQAQSLAPLLTGRLSRKAIYVRRAKELSTGASQSYVVAVRRGTKEAKKDRDAYYWWFIEFGTRKMAARPFLRPAFEAKKFEALDRVKEKLAQWIAKNSGVR